MNDKICGYSLDNDQKNIVINDDDYLLVVAGAGSGKTFTILGKIDYLIKYKNIKESEILCISFTNKSSSDLKNKIKYNLNLNIDVLTFHKLAINILDEYNYKFSICPNDLLNIIVEKFFSVDILNSYYHLKLFFLFYNIKFNNNYIDNYLFFYKKNYEKIKILENNIITFINLFKTNKFNENDFNKFLKQSKSIFNIFNYRKDKIFLTFVVNIYFLYKNYLIENNLIDFNDMINLSTNFVNNYNYNKKIKYIIIDEYQDTSLIRFNLIKAIIDKTNSKLMAVGDDFQSIYKFTGCDLSLFINFNKYFKDGKVLKIENTYRNSQELIFVAGNFVMKNKKQIKKNLISNKSIKKPIIIKYYKNKIEFTNFILYLYKKCNSILVLGRNNKDIFDYINNDWLIKNDIFSYKYDNNIYFKYLTVHKSKGLEDDVVVLINLYNNITGFPSKFKNNRYLRYVSINEEKYPYAEERRLFYVALTRTKNYVYLFTPKKNKSIFVDELIYNYKKYIEII